MRPPIIDLCWPSSFVQRAKEEETWDSSEIYSPWCARAIAPYPAPGQRTHPSDLQFEAGDLISLTSKHCDEWWTGYKVLPSGNRAHGTFPRKLVKILPPDSKDHEVANRGGVNSNSQVGDGSGGWTTGTRKQRPPTANSRGAAASDERRSRRQSIETAATPRSIIGSGVGALTVPDDQAELAVLFRIWDPDGSRELRRHELQGAVQSLWRQFNHPLAFDRAARCVHFERTQATAHHIVEGFVLSGLQITRCNSPYRTLQLMEGPAAGAVRGLADLQVFLRTVAYAAEQWTAMADLDRVHERKIDRVEFGSAVRKLGLRARSGKPMNEAQIDAAFQVALNPLGPSPAGGAANSPLRRGQSGGAGGASRAMYASFEEACCSLIRCAVRGRLSAPTGGAKTSTGSSSCHVWRIQE